MRTNKTIGFADLAAARRIKKEDFLTHINKIIDWRPVGNIINKNYQKGKSHTGRPAYDGLLLFKICLLQNWYNLSDYEAEERINDSLSFSHFLGLSLEKTAPDHSVICRFSREIVEKGIFEKLFKALNKQLEKHKIIVKKGVLIDASMTNSHFWPNAKPDLELVPVDREEDEKVVKKLEEPKEKPKAKEQIISSGDTEARFSRKRGELHFGYKKHVATDEQGLVLGLVTTPANISDTTQLAQILATFEVKKWTRIKADKGYKSAKNDEILKKLALKNGIMHKKKKGKKIGIWEDKFNKLISKTRYRIERTFGSIKSWFGGGKTRYRGLKKTHAQHLLEAMAYNLYRVPRIAMSIPV